MAQQPQPMTNNQAISAQQALDRVMADLNARRDDIAAGLPADLPIDAFLATVNQALRNEPKILRCSVASIINACIKAAYDGLRVDGKEAAIVPSKERGNVGGQWQDVWVARYMPMVFGLVKQILAGGQVIAMQARIVYQNEVDQGRFDYEEGDNPRLFHKPIVIGERGAPVAVYSRATLVGGHRECRLLTKDQVLKIQEASPSGWKDGKPATKGVWHDWLEAMWEKCAIRQHRKTLPGTSHIRDAEAEELFPQWDRSTPHPQLQAPSARPTRPSTAALGSSVGTESGQPLQGNDADDRVVDPQTARQEQRDTGRQDTRQVQQNQKATPTAEPEVQAPEDWDAWARDFEAQIEQAAPADVQTLWADNDAVLQAAPSEIRDHLLGVFTGRLADLVEG